LILLANPGGKAAEKSDPSAELKDLVEKIQTKLKEGKKTDKDLGDELKEFDALLVKHKDEKTDEVAQILLMEAMLYLQVFDNTEKGVELVKQLKRDFADTKTGKNADQILESIQKQEQTKKVQRALVAGAKFPDFSEKDVAGKSLSVANYQGKVVLVDFWATWCGPCVAALPHLDKIYKDNKGAGLKVFAVNQREGKEHVAEFIKSKGWSLPVLMDVEGNVGKLYLVNGIPQTVVIGKDGVIKKVAVGFNPDGDDALRELIAKEMAAGAAAN
jgi:thiol-disulfide isomerase/thioredoxin